MAKATISFSLLLFVLTLLSMKTSLRVTEACSLAVVGGGCPDLGQCIITCSPCWRGTGRVNAFCKPAGGDIPVDQCICEFVDGAPCPPPPPPKCPGPPFKAFYINNTRAN